MKKFDIKDLKSDILHDFDKLIDYLCTNNPKLTDSKETLPIQAVIDLNNLIKNPILLSSRPQQEHCPRINFLYHLVIYSNLFVKQKIGKKLELKKTEYLDIYNSFNDTEKYFYLLQSWWCYSNWKFLYDFRLYDELGDTLEIVVNAMKTNSPDTWINLDNIETPYKIKSLGRDLLMSFEYFGLWNVEFNKDNPSKYDYCDSIMFNRFGNEIVGKLYIKRDFNTWNEYTAILKGGKSKNKNFISAFKNLFEKNELERTIPKEKKTIKGNYTFKISYGKVYAIIKINSKITLDEFHEIIQEVIDFDNDHLYCFYMDGRDNELKTYVSPNDDGYNYADYIKIEELELYEGQKFEYLFDYGDRWRFPITVEKIERDEAEIEKPLLIKLQGKFPEQYDFEDDGMW